MKVSTTRKGSVKDHKTVETQPPVVDEVVYSATVDPAGAIRLRWPNPAVKEYVVIPGKDETKIIPVIGDRYLVRSEDGRIPLRGSSPGERVIIQHQAEDLGGEITVFSADYELPAANAVEGFLGLPDTDACVRDERLVAIRYRGGYYRGDTAIIGVARINKNWDRLWGSMGHGVSGLARKVGFAHERDAPMRQRAKPVSNGLGGARGSDRAATVPVRAQN